MSAWAAGPPKQSAFEGDVPLGMVLKLTTVVSDEVITGEVRHSRTSLTPARQL